MAKITVVAVDDHPLFLDAVRSSITAYPEMELVAVGYVGEDVLPLVSKHKPDVLLLDQSMPKFHDPEQCEVFFRPLPTIRKLKREYPTVHIIILSAMADSIMVNMAIKAGVSGYISKSDADMDIAATIRTVLDTGLYLSRTAGDAYLRRAQVNLTQRQLEVLTVINRNPTRDYDELANELGMSESTFKKHLTLAMKRLGVPNNKLAAVKLCEKLGLFS